MAKVYKGAFSGTLPVTLRTGEGYLESYKIYGNPSGCGVKVDITGLSEPLCGIGTHTDSLGLSTGILTMKIKKLVLTGEESWSYSATNAPFKLNLTEEIRIPLSTVVFWCCSHYEAVSNSASWASYDSCISWSTADGRSGLRFRDIRYSNLDDFKTYIAQQYANGTPVTVWYVLAEPEVSTIPVLSGLTGTIEGYLIQDGTPSPETPIYPTANGVKQADGTYSIPYGYKLPLMVNGAEYPIYIGNEQLAKDEYVDSTTVKIYRRTKNLSPPEEEWMDEWIWGDGTIHPSTEIKTSPFIDVSTCETCIMEVFSTETEWAAAGYREMAFYDENKQYLDRIGGGGRQALTPNSSENLSEFPAGTVYVRIGCSHGDQPFYPQLVSGYTPTHQFYPYLIPTDPPAPLPEIPTFAGTTVIDYAGESLAPSQFDGVAGWGNLPVKKLNGVPYTGTLPAVLAGTKAGYLYKYEVYGNTVQDGTPTPENPIMPIGCGEIETTGVHAGQYKLPILSNSTVTNIYLGEVQTTRRIKKLVLTGEEGITRHSIVNNIVGVRIPTPTVVAAGSPIICTHATNVSWANYYGFRTYAMVASNASAGNLIIYMSAPDSEHNTLSDIKSYLAAQYAAGTPVTVWYVPAEPETSIVNEPLMKIGDYADTIDSTQSSVQLPTSAGSTTISWAGEGLAPSQFDSIQEWVDIPTYTRVNGKWITEECNEIVGE